MSTCGICQWFQPLASSRGGECYCEPPHVSNGASARPVVGQGTRACSRFAPAAKPDPVAPKIEPVDPDVARTIGATYPALAPRIIQAPRGKRR